MLIEKSKTVLIHGREVGFRKNPYADARIRAFVQRFEKEKKKTVKELDGAENLEFTAGVCAILSEGEEHYRHFCDRGYQMKPLTAEEFLLCDEKEMNALLDLMRGEERAKPEIEAKEAPPEPGSEKSKKKPSKSNGAKAGINTSDK